MIKNKNIFYVIFLWYLIPFLYVTFFKNIELDNSLVIIIVFLSSLALGFFLTNNIQVSLNAKFVIPKLFNYKLILYLTIALQFLSFYRLYQNGINYFEHRKLVFDDPTYLFGSSILTTLYNSFLLPISLIQTVYILSNTTKLKLNSQIYIILVILLFDAILKFGRFQLFYIVYLLLLYNIGFRIRRFYIVLAFPILVILSLIVVFYRQYYLDAAIGGIADIINFDVLETTIFSYQYYGYILLDNFTKIVSPYGSFFEFHTFAYPLYLLELITTKFGVFIDYPWELINIKLSSGLYISSLGTEINAFSTNFLPIFLDYGFVGIFVYGFFSGFVIGYRTSSRFLYFVKHMNVFVLFFGIYQPIIITVFGIFSNPLLFLLLCKFKVVRV